MLPGFIDSHVHILEGGGEGSFKTRAPEIQLSDLLLGEVTTVVGCLGTDVILIDKVMVTGEIAISDHRSSQYTFNEFVNVIAQARVGGFVDLTTSSDPEFLEEGED